MINVDQLTRRFGSITAVNAITFDVRRGELFGVVGPDGAGKTTLFRMLAGVLPPSDGDAVLNEVSVARAPEKTKHFIAYMSQRFGLYTDLTVIENLHFYADLYRVPANERAQRLERVFQFSGLGPFRDRLAGKLSGGMKQKLGLSCALIHQPVILLLDEPTFGVDPISRRDLWIIIHEMVSEGVTTVVSTAYLDEAERFDRIALLHSGKLVALETPAKLIESTEGKVLEVQTRRVREARRVAQQVSGVQHALLSGEKLRLIVASADVAGVVGKALRSAGVEATVKPGIPTLEEVMIDLTGSEQAA